MKTWFECWLTYERLGHTITLTHTIHYISPAFCCSSSVSYVMWWCMSHLFSAIWDYLCCKLYLHTCRVSSSSWCCPSSNCCSLASKLFGAPLLPQLEIQLQWTVVKWKGLVWCRCRLSNFQAWRLTQSTTCQHLHPLQNWKFHWVGWTILYNY